MNPLRCRNVNPSNDVVGIMFREQTTRNHGAWTPPHQKLWTIISGFGIFSIFLERKRVRN